MASAVFAVLRSAWFCQLAKNIYICLIFLSHQNQLDKIMKISELKARFDHLMQSPENWKLHDLHIIAPYPTDSFFNELINHFKPENKLHLYVDDGWPNFKVEDIENVLNKHRVKYDEIKRIAASNSKLVHAKIYFFKWKNDDGGCIRHILIGSANASLSGFGGNAETYALIWRGDIEPLDEQNQFPIEKNYFSALAKNGTCNECNLQIGQSSWISLPAIKTVSKTLSSFDAWLQRGYLCHKFDPTPNFGKFVVKLTNSIPPSDGLSAFTQANLQSQTASTQITESYIPQLTGRPGKGSRKWKSKFFVETIYGHWASEDCYKELHETFSAEGAKDRKRDIDFILKMQNCNSQITTFLNKLQTAANFLEKSASRYLKTNGRTIDTQYYRNIANAKFKKDMKIAADDTFATRYIQGYAFPSFPSVDEKSFEEFALSFCDEILLEINKGNTQNKLAKAFRAKNFGAYYAEDLLFELRNNWPAHSEIIRNYWR